MQSARCCIRYWLISTCVSYFVISVGSLDISVGFIYISFVFSQKIDLVSHPARAEGSVNMGTTTPSQSGPGSNVNKGVPHTPQIFRTEAS